MVNYSVLLPWPAIMRRRASQFVEVLTSCHLGRIVTIMYARIGTGDLMRYLLDTGRMAYKFGILRGALYLVVSTVPLALANFFAKVFSILPGQSKPSVVIQWAEIGFYTLAMLLCAYGCYRLYRDYAHHDYFLEADRYQREGW
ncbi:hypothetical protein HZU83_21770 [Sphaerotilus montanus]|uniref:Uncharacterized protein n=1 Tax=Sphaerotilus montanus TaxID=522889 RepID=A0A7Y9U7Z4_9BURK|nr:hypothetical protein [Sphaerotilus montanus]NYG34317.1 hypothetical protein [Sphaerotilus montanus]NZD59312.1 hypothetical protein [Sphaerotilus montanus]